MCPRKTGSKSYITSFGNTATLLILRPEWVLSLLCSTEKPGQNCLKFHPLLNARWTKSQDEHAKLKMKINNTNLGQDIKSGDTVLIRNETGNKLTPAYNPKPHVVLNAKGTMISAVFRPIGEVCNPQCAVFQKDQASRRHTTTVLRSGWGRGNNHNQNTRIALHYYAPDGRVQRIGAEWNCQFKYDQREAVYYQIRPSSPTAQCI